MDPRTQPLVSRFDAASGVVDDVPADHGRVPVHREEQRAELMPRVRLRTSLCEQCRTPFCWRPARGYGWLRFCKSCAAERNREQKRAYQLRNREELRAKGREYMARVQATNPERLRETARRYRAAHPERVAEIRRRFYERHPHAAANRQMARRVGKNGVDRAAVYERDKGICQICFSPVDSRRFHVDHIVPVARGGKHSYANVQLSHPFCNQSKGARL